MKKKWRVDKRNDKALYELQIGLSKGEITKDQIHQVISLVETPTSHENEPIVVTFGLKIEDVQEQGIYSEDLLSDYPKLCDRLEIDLITGLHSIISADFFICEDLRNGECLSVRIAFGNFKPKQIAEFYEIPLGNSRSGVVFRYLWGNYFNR